MCDHVQKAEEGKRRYCAPPVEVVAVGALISILCVCWQGGCCLQAVPVSPEGEGEAPLNPLLLAGHGGPDLMQA
jgi:hypothetical protein